jgi:hypothetical protein
VEIRRLRLTEAFKTDAVRLVGESVRPLAQGDLAPREFADQAAQTGLQEERNFQLPAV